MFPSVKTAKVRLKAKMEAKGHGKAEKAKVVRVSTFMGRALGVCHRSISRESGIVQRNGRHGHSNNIISRPPARNNTLISRNSNKRSTKHRDHKGQEELVSQGEQLGLG